MSYLDLDLPEDDFNIFAIFNEDEAFSAAPPAPTVANNNSFAQPVDQPQFEQQHAAIQTQEHGYVDLRLNSVVQISARSYSPATAIQPSSVPFGQNNEDLTSRSAEFSSPPPAKRNKYQQQVGTETTIPSVTLTGPSTGTSTGRSSEFWTGPSNELTMPGAAPGNIPQVSPLKQILPLPFVTGNDHNRSPEMALQQFGDRLIKVLEILENKNPGVHELVRFVPTVSKLSSLSDYICATEHLCLRLDPYSNKNPKTLHTNRREYFMKVAWP
ncbi:hypothetical protein FBEOM_6445 [Fusarium beomiforme]|uniref:Uncharacterized protein n=1 Tax=Fusarium beomiforme TaxID=44412 RepID=A0A9P5AJ43_9HYPO|nr:hypothetical protein FBEOM_6445 [Fusarium beomiforme]